MHRAGKMVTKSLLILLFILSSDAFVLRPSWRAASVVKAGSSGAAGAGATAGAGAAAAVMTRAWQRTIVLRASSPSDQETPVISARQKISDALTPTELSVTAAYDDPNGSHISIVVVSDKFEGVSRVKRQQMVYKAIWEEMQGAIHAVDSMVCKTPDENA